LGIGWNAFHLILPLTVQYDFLPFDESVKSFTCKLLLCSIKGESRILVSDLDSDSTIRFACKSCSLYDSLSLTRYMIDESLCLQLIECIRCGYRRRETWLMQDSLQKKEEEKDRTSSPERIRKRRNARLKKEMQ
jgi:Zn ribbon nucleic-acid-binding protein